MLINARISRVLRELAPTTDRDGGRG